MNYIVRFGRFGPYPQHQKLTADQVAATLADETNTDLTRPDGSRVTLDTCLAMGGLEVISGDVTPAAITINTAHQAPEAPDAGERQAE